MRRSAAGLTMNFGLAPEIEEIRDIVARWVAEYLQPIAAEIDEKNAFPRQLWPAMGELGLLGITADEEYGGTGLGYLGALRRDGRNLPWLQRLSGFLMVLIRTSV